MCAGEMESRAPVPCLRRLRLFVRRLSVRRLGWILVRRLLVLLHFLLLLHVFLGLLLRLLLVTLF
jgi:hypothetical protein